MNEINHYNREKECCICFELMERNNNKLFLCNHNNFHTSCVMRCERCPLCRAPFNNIIEDIDTVKILISFTNNLIYGLTINTLILLIIIIIIY